MIKIYFLEKSIPFNSNDLNSPIIAGTEKTLINITNELSNNENFFNRRDWFYWLSLYK